MDDYILALTDVLDVEVHDEVLYGGNHYVILSKEEDGENVTFTVECQNSTEAPEEITFSIYDEVNVIYS